MRPYRIILLTLLFMAPVLVWGANGLFSVVNYGQNGAFFVDSTQKKLVLPPAVNDSTKPLSVDTKTDSLQQNFDSTRQKTDTTAQTGGDSIVRFKVSKDALDADVVYKAKDSIIYDIAHRMVYLYGEAYVKYKTTEMNAHIITMDWNTSIITGETELDTAGQPVGDVVFKESNDTYFAKKLAYDFKTKKGKVLQARTKQDQGYIHLEEAKRNEYEEWYGRKGWYTTCDLEHPHFYIEASKMKLVPQKVIVTGPAHLVIHDVPTPLYIPFGIFPVKKGRRSGIVLPQYGEEQNRGFYFRNGGYYFGISDNFDLTLTGDIYTKGSWALRTDTRYVKRYKFNGDVFLQYGRNRLGEPEAPDFQVSNEFKVNWVHHQDPKARPNSTFSANVNFATATFDKTYSYSQEAVTNSLLASKVSYTRTWGNKPFSLGINILHDQNLNTHTVNLTAPQITFGVTRITPFKRSVSTGKPKWYESLGFSYNFETQNVIQGVDSTFFRGSTFKNAKYGVRQTLPISTSFTLFKYFTLSPSFSYTERWYLQSVRKRFVLDTSEAGGSIVTDTVFGFKQSQDFNAALSLTTKVFGMFQFKNSKIKAIRHVMTPSVSFQYRPDFSKPFWGNYKTVQSDTQGNTKLYSIFEPVSGIYGDAPIGAQAGLNFSVSNSLEMKVFSKKDTARNEKKIKLLENLTISTFYNFIADSLKLNPISISGYTTLFDKFRVNFSTSLDPYTYNINNTRINTFVWNDKHRLVTMRNASLSVSTSLQSKKGGVEKNIDNATHSTPEEKQAVLTAPSLYYDFTVPWSFNFTYSLNLARGVVGNPDSLFFSANSIRIEADITITEKWKINVSTGYDFNLKDLVYTQVRVIRDLHCWELSFNWVPYPLNRQSYDMQINVKSSILQDLKLSKKKSQFDSAF